MYLTFRPDRVYQFQDEKLYNKYWDRLEEACNKNISTYQELLHALNNRISFFNSLGCRAAGGVEPTKENLHTWFKAGVKCVGMGSKLFDEQHIHARNWNAVENKIASTLALIQEIRNEIANKS